MRMIRHNREVSKEGTTMTPEQLKTTTKAAEIKFENGEELTEAELNLLSPALRLAYQDDLTEEAEHQRLMDDDY